MAELRQGVNTILKEDFFGTPILGKPQATVEQAKTLGRYWKRSIPDIQAGGLGEVYFNRDRGHGGQVNHRSAGVIIIHSELMLFMSCFTNADRKICVIAINGSSNLYCIPTVAVR